MKGAMIKGFGNRPRTNVTGQGPHPGKRSIVRNSANQPTQLGQDGFSARQAKPKESIVKGQGHVS